MEHQNQLVPLFIQQRHYKSSAIVNITD